MTEAPKPTEPVSPAYTSGGVLRLPPGWKRLTAEGGAYHHAEPMMFVRQRDDGSWWTSMKVGAVDWHSYSHRTARAAMLAGSTIAALVRRVAT